VSEVAHTKRCSFPQLVIVAAIIAAVAPFNCQAQSKAADADPVIANARSAATAFIDSLPKYTVKRTTTRYESDRRACSAGAMLAGIDCDAGTEKWRTLDIVTADVVVEHGKEVDSNIRLNGAPATQQDIDLGSWAVGDFTGTLQAILSPASAARFMNKRSTTLLKRPAYRYDYSIDQPHSSWHLDIGTAILTPGYGGSIWFDKETSRVLRVEMSARALPVSFPANRVEWTVDYDFVNVAGGTYLLPKDSETRNCQRETSVCERNATEFKNYKEFSADSNITFDAPK
jgi:hypothetical protein